MAAFARLDVEHRLVFNLMAREIARSVSFMELFARFDQSEDPCRKLHDFNAAQLGELVTCPGTSRDAYDDTKNARHFMTLPT